MRTLWHIIKLVWAETGNTARAFYVLIAITPNVAASPLASVEPFKWALDHTLFLLWEGGSVPVSDAALIAVVALGVWTIFSLSKLTLRQEDELAPSIAVEFPAGGGGMVETPEKARNVDLSTSAEWSTIYIRVRVESTSKMVARGCSAHLVAIEKDVGNGFQPTAFVDSLQLPWALIGVGEVDIPYRVKRFVDVIKINDRDKKLKFVVPWPLTLRNFFDDHATYRLTVVVASGEISQSIDLDVVWTGGMDTLEVMEAHNGTG